MVWRLVLVGVAVAPYVTWEWQMVRRCHCRQNGAVPLAPPSNA
jgi:hypothetical protein